MLRQWPQNIKPELKAPLGFMQLYWLHSHESGPGLCWEWSFCGRWMYFSWEMLSSTLHYQESLQRRTNIFYWPPQWNMSPTPSLELNIPSLGSSCSSTNLHMPSRGAKEPPYSQFCTLPGPYSIRTSIIYTSSSTGTDYSKNFPPWNF